MQRWVVVCWALLALVGADVCPDGGRCEGAQSCCKDPVGGYTCCPSEQVMEAREGEEDDTKPPHCPPGFSCQRALTVVGGCPQAQGSVCSDGKHCCPEGSLCSADGRFCMKQKEVVCKDGVSRCPDGTTCCENPEGKFGCCPYPEAVCCEDKLHCCPHGDTCDLKRSMCVSSSTKDETPMLTKLPARPRADWKNWKASMLACNETAACPDSSTCCKTKEGGWSCCPLPEAVCCSDLIHCCPKGMTCDLTTLTCDQGGRSAPLVRKVPAVPRLRARDVVCDPNHSCLDGSTCCKTTTGEWACCPMPQAVCCDDHMHCCPTGTTCDPSGLKCNSPSGPVPARRKTPALVARGRAEGGAGKGRVQCNARTSCPQDTTCCFMESTKEWGCCPLPGAVCCANGKHCCPAHYKCDESQTKCVKGPVVIPWYTKLPAISSGVRDIQCPDQSTCQDGQTCCKVSETQWACCPLPNAVCCNDMKHCCPNGYTCTAEGNCKQTGGPRWDSGSSSTTKRKFRFCE